MGKLLFMSILIVTMAIPMWASGMKDVRAGLRRVRVVFAIFMVFWTIFVAYYYTDMTPVDPELLQKK